MIQVILGGVIPHTTITKRQQIATLMTVCYQVSFATIWPAL